MEDFEIIGEIEFTQRIVGMMMIEVHEDLSISKDDEAYRLIQQAYSNLGRAHGLIKQRFEELYERAADPENKGAWFICGYCKRDVGLADKFCRHCGHILDLLERVKGE